MSDRNSRCWTAAYRWRTPLAPQVSDYIVDVGHGVVTAPAGAKCAA